MNAQKPTWVVDYSAARARAIHWLGDRYLLARPINAGYASRLPATATDLPEPATILDSESAAQLCAAPCA